MALTRVSKAQFEQLRGKYEAGELSPRKAQLFEEADARRQTLTTPDLTQLNRFYRSGKYQPEEHQEGLLSKLAENFGLDTTGGAAQAFITMMHTEMRGRRYSTALCILPRRQIISILF